MITIFDWFGYEVPYKERYQLIKKADQHHMPFDGNINWDVVMKKLTNINYKGPTALKL